MTRLLSPQLLPFGAAIVVLLLYAPAAANGFVWDDIPGIVESAAFQGSISAVISSSQNDYLDPTFRANPGVVPSHDSYRPLLNAWYWLDLRLFNGIPTVMHAENILLAALLAACFALLALRLLGSGIPAVVAVAVMILHPLQVEPIAYVSARGELLAALLVVLAALLSLPQGHTRQRSACRLAGAALMTLGACLCKETAMAAPIAVGVIATTSSGWKRGTLVTTVLAAAVFAVFAWRTAVLRGMGFSPDIVTSLPLLPSFLVQAAVVTLVPFDLSVFRPAHPSMTGQSWTALVGIACLVAFICVRQSRKALDRGRFLYAGLVWWVAMLGPPFLATLVTEVLPDRYFCLPMVGVALGVGAAWPDTQSRRMAVLSLTALGIVALSWCAVSSLQIRVWRNDIALFTNAVAAHPRSAQAQFSLGTALRKNRHLDQAEQHLALAAALAPHEGRYCNNHGVVLLDLGKQEQGLAELERCLTITDGKNPDAWFNLGLTHIEAGKIEQGCREVQNALKIWPGLEPAQRRWDKSCRQRTP